MSPLARIAAAALFLVTGCTAAKPQAPILPVTKSVSLVGDFTTNAWAYGRDAGNSVRMGNEILWAFGDTFTWTGFECATAAWSSVDSPLELSEPVGPWFESLPFYELSSTETQFNKERKPPRCCKQTKACSADQKYCHCPTGTDCRTRIAIWPGDMISIDGQLGIHYYEKVEVGSAPYDFRHLGTGIAIVRDGDTKATRPSGDDGEPLLIFGPDEPNFLRGLLVEEGPRLVVYLYAASNRRKCQVDILLARVDLSNVFRQGEYRFWTGSAWSPSLADAAPVLDTIRGGLGSVTWNRHLNRYLSAFSDICSGGGALQLRTAPLPQGPWTDAVAVDLSSLGATPDSYAGQIHSSLGIDAELFFSFYQPLELGVGRLRLGRMVLE